ncbi:MAG: hypothetical protein SVV03_02535 [Candidatus Nanohaloarchaea archaeon]|nr:hypothetical protein [Candidatus Nanohaloarchaea archaeon]
MTTLYHFRNDDGTGTVVSLSAASEEEIVEAALENYDEVARLKEEEVWRNSGEV